MYDRETIGNYLDYRVRISGDNEAIYDYDTGRHFSFRDMDRRSTALASFLINELHMKKGDRIGFCATNNVAMYDAYYVTFKTGIILTTYNCLLKEQELHTLIENEAPAVIFYSKEFTHIADGLKKAGFKQEFMCVDEKGAEDKYDYNEIVNRTDVAKLPLPNVTAEDIQMLIHTGGTTGTPKAAMLSFRSLFFNTLCDQTVFELTGKDTALITLPLFHTAGWNVLNVPVLYAGGRVIIVKNFTPDKVIKIIREERPTVGMSVETIYRALAMHPDFPDLDLSSVRFFITGAAPTGKELLEKYWAKGVKMLNAYGMTEIGPNNVCPPLSTMSIDDVRKKWNSCGIPAPYNQLRIVDDDNNDVPQGEKGELIFKGMMSFSGYWNNETASAAMFDDGWVHTGDVGYLDEDGFCYISGRKKNMYISGGENIFPQEIEDVILTMPGVMEVCILGVPDPKWGEVGRALIVKDPSSPITKEEVMKKVKDDLSSIKVPHYVTFLDQIPKNAVGKRDLNGIKALFGKAED